MLAATAPIQPGWLANSAASRTLSAKWSSTVLSANAAVRAQVPVHPPEPRQYQWLHVPTNGALMLPVLHRRHRREASEEIGHIPR